ncbi:hypothetical protein [Azospirillum sp.]|nr:hypothetical protein [Azospirillum sp.]HYD70575.1 hypothetical protein [Azospirillum sp.]
MTALLRAGGTGLGLALLVAAWILYQTPAMGMMLSAVTFCQ